MKTKVGGSSDERGQARRFAVAIPSAIAITAALVILAQIKPADRTVAERTPVTTVLLERAAPTPRPTPTPKPTPPPTLPPVATVTLAPVVQRAGPPAAHHRAGGAHAAQRALPHVAPAKAFAVPAAGGGNGASVIAGTGTGMGSGDGAGAGDSGGGGNGTADAPCGYVDLIPFEAPDHNGSITLEHIRATVTFPDGHTQSDEFPYRWIYSDPAADPWSARNMNDPKFVVRVQSPPEGANESRFPEVIRYILDHTRRDTGTTTLQECPRAR